MALDTYANLQTSILSWLGRPGDSTIPVTDIIALFETDASRKLRTHNQETSQTITTVAGTDSYALSADFLAAREVKLTTTNPIRELEYMTPSELDEFWTLTTTDQPINYTIEASNIRFGPIPDAVYTIKVNYFAAVPALSNSNTTNWLLTNNPDLYLFGSLAEAELFLGADSSDDRFGIFLQRREKGYADLLLQDRKYRLGSAPLAMKSVVRTP